MARAKILMVGFGGLGSHIGLIFVQMMLAQLDVIDPDIAEDSNRNRQLVTESDVGKPKAHQILKNIAPYATGRTLLRGYYTTFENWAKRRRRSQYSAVCCGVDSIPTMAAVARYAHRTHTPATFINVSSDGEACRVFVQRCGSLDACFACYMPSALAPQPERDQPCTPVPAIADILRVAAGFAARATMGEIMGSPIGDYNCRDITFSGCDIRKTVQQRADCPICHGQAI